MSVHVVVFAVWSLVAAGAGSVGGWLAARRRRTWQAGFTACAQTISATCDWGDCDSPTAGLRWDRDYGWLTVCAEHELDSMAPQISRSASYGSPEDGPGSPASGGELAIIPGPGSEPFGVTGPVPGSTIYPALAALAADDVPRPGGLAPAGSAGPGHSWYAERLHEHATWIAQRQVFDHAWWDGYLADVDRWDEYAARWAEDARQALKPRWVLAGEMAGGL